MSYKALKSGTDIRGFAADGFESEPLFLSDERVKNITLSFADFLTKKTGKSCGELKISVGHDSRVSAERIKSAVISALTSKGVSVFDCALASTPAMFMSVLDLKCDGAVQITASHHPWERNGLKFFTPEGGLEGEDISEILTMAESRNDEITADLSLVTAVDYMKDYAASLRKMIKDGVNADDYEMPLKGYKIIVDAGNGVGGFYANNVLAPLGANVEGSQFLEPDGMFPNHIPNPENADAMASVCAATVKAVADLGIIFDTDVDRAGCVDKNGEEINRNSLVALASAIALDGQSGVIVTDSVTSDGLREFIEAMGGEHYRYKRGYKNVINKQIELNNAGRFCPLAMETSGHAAFKENYYLDDGAYLMTKIVIYMAKNGGVQSIQKILSTLKQPKEAIELRFNIKCDDFKDYGAKVLDELVEYFDGKAGWQIADDNRDGIRVSADSENGDGWFLLRQSVHDPVMPFNAESNSVGGNMKIVKAFYEFIKDKSLLDLTAIENFIK
ncbi:MAG: phosphomannomutase/phosphoglucomutase [Clostridia bacterium]|nr:phosphomannomutase/phosphoglucomutase [Clostridia bacterium]